MKDEGTFPDTLHSTDAFEFFHRGSVVLVTLNAPREKFWGVLLSLSPTGVVLRGIPLSGFEDFVRQVCSGDRASTSTVFFPLHRVERMEADSPDGDVPSLSEQFMTKTGCSALAMLTGGTGASK